MDCLRELESERIVVPRLEIATSLRAQSIGLLGRSELPDGNGLWLEPCNGIHTWGMRFAIDVLFLDRNGLALRAVPHVPPWRLCGPVWRARVVIELPAGTLASAAIQTGRHYGRAPR